MASLYADGKTPDDSDLLTMWVIGVARDGSADLTSSVGRGSWTHDFDAKDFRRADTCCGVRGENSTNDDDDDGEWPLATAAAATAAPLGMDERMVLIFVIKKSEKRSGSLVTAQVEGSAASFALPSKRFAI